MSCNNFKINKTYRSRLYYNKYLYSIHCNRCDSEHIFKKLKQHGAVICGKWYGDIYDGFKMYDNDLKLLKKILHEHSYSYDNVEVSKAIVAYSTDHIIFKSPKFKYRLKIEIKSGNVNTCKALATYLSENYFRLNLNSSATYLKDMLPLIEPVRSMGFMYTNSDIIIDTNEESDITMLNLMGFDVKMKRIISQEEAKKTALLS